MRTKVKGERCQSSLKGFPSIPVGPLLFIFLTAKESGKQSLLELLLSLATQKLLLTTQEEEEGCKTGYFTTGVQGCGGGWVIKSELILQRPSGWFPAPMLGSSQGWTPSSGYHRHCTLCMIFFFF